MFGFELQTGNVFITGCPERHVAFRHASKKVTLEADEGHLQDGSTDLEFVTAPCTDWASAGEALEIAASIAKILAGRADPSTKIIKIAPGPDKELGGTWEKECVISVPEPGFRAAVQGTVGVPLAGLPEFIKTTFTRINAGEGNTAEQWQQIEDRTAKSVGGHQVSDQLRGFLTACHMFLLRATEPPLKGQLWSTFFRTGVPDGYRLFDMSGNQYITSLGSFEFPEESGRHWVIIQADGPKALFPLLHRTDFRHMFLSLVANDQQFVKTTAATGGLWPGDPAKTYLFPYPYRGEEEATDLDARAAGLWALGTEVGGNTKNAPWTLITHGPTVASWWDSVLNGDAARGRLAKDSASPPPGWRGRKADLIEVLPGDGEDKSTYYGMGAFPMDNKSGNTPLAVFEHRFLVSDQDMVKDSNPTVGNWVATGKLFYDNYVPK